MVLMVILISDLALVAEANRLRQLTFRTYRAQKNYAVTTGKWYEFHFSKYLLNHKYSANIIQYFNNVLKVFRI